MLPKHAKEEAEAIPSIEKAPRSLTPEGHEKKKDGIGEIQNIPIRTPSSHSGRSADSKSPANEEEKKDAEVLGKAYEEESNVTKTSTKSSEEVAAKVEDRKRKWEEVGGEMKGNEKKVKGEEKKKTKKKKNQKWEGFGDEGFEMKSGALYDPREWSGKGW